MKSITGCIALAGALSIATSAFAADPVTLTIMGHKFIPSEVTVPAGQRFQIKVINMDGTPAEFESHEMKIEKIVVPNGTITVNAGPLKPGMYKFFDEYNPDSANGILTAKE